MNFGDRREVLSGGDPDRIRTCDPQIRNLLPIVDLVIVFWPHAAFMLHSCGYEVRATLAEQHQPE